MNVCEGFVVNWQAWATFLGPVSGCVASAIIAARSWFKPEQDRKNEELRLEEDRKRREEDRKNEELRLEEDRKNKERKKEQENVNYIHNKLRRIVCEYPIWDSIRVPESSDGLEYDENLFAAFYSAFTGHIKTASKKDQNGNNISITYWPNMINADGKAKEHMHNTLLALKDLENDEHYNKIAPNDLARIVSSLRMNMHFAYNGFIECQKEDENVKNTTVVFPKMWRQIPYYIRNVQNNLDRLENRLCKLRKDVGLCFENDV